MSFETAVTRKKLVTHTRLGNSTLHHIPFFFGSFPVPFHTAFDVYCLHSHYLSIVPFVGCGYVRYFSCTFPFCPINEGFVTEGFEGKGGGRGGWGGAYDRGWKFILFFNTLSKSHVPKAEFIRSYELKKKNLTNKNKKKRI